MYIKSCGSLKKIEIIKVKKVDWILNLQVSVIFYFFLIINVIIYCNFSLKFLDPTLNSLHALAITIYHEILLKIWIRYNLFEICVNFNRQHTYTFLCRFTYMHCANIFVSFLFADKRWMQFEVKFWQLILILTRW